MEEKEEVYSIIEFARILKVHPNTVRRAIKYGRIQAFRVGTGKSATFRIYKDEMKRMAQWDMTKTIDKIIEERSNN